MLYFCEPDCKYCKYNFWWAEKRFWQRVNKTRTCWLWMGSRDALGYGRFSFMGTGVYAHRFSKALVEPLERDKELDHLCRVTSCVNPDHLEQVTHRTNILRSPIHPGAVNSRRVVCRKGHKFTKLKSGNRRCLGCKSEYQKKYWLQYKKRFAIIEGL